MSALVLNRAGETRTWPAAPRTVTSMAARSNAVVRVAASFVV